MTKKDFNLIGLMFVGNIIHIVCKFLGIQVPRKLQDALYRSIADEIKNDPNCIKFTGCRSAVTGEQFNADWIDQGACPLISDQGLLLVTHGNQDGTVMVNNGQGRLMKVRIDDNRFTDIFNPTLFPIAVLACYPNARPIYWEFNGRRFWTPNQEHYVPMFLPTVNGTIYYAPMSFHLALELKLI